MQENIGRALQIRKATKNTFTEFGSNPRLSSRAAVTNREKRQKKGGPGVVGREKSEPAPGNRSVKRRQGVRNSRRSISVRPPFRPSQTGGQKNVCHHHSARTHSPPAIQFSSAFPISLSTVDSLSQRFKFKTCYSSLIATLGAVSMHNLTSGRQSSRLDTCSFTGHSPNKSTS